MSDLKKKNGENYHLMSKILFTQYASFIHHTSFTLDIFEPISFMCSFVDCIDCNFLHVLVYQINKIVQN